MGEHPRKIERQDASLSLPAFGVFDYEEGRSGWLVVTAIFVNAVLTSQARVGRLDRELPLAFGHQVLVKQTAILTAGLMVGLPGALDDITRHHCFDSLDGTGFASLPGDFAASTDNIEIIHAREVVSAFGMVFEENSDILSELSIKHIAHHDV